MGIAELLNSDGGAGLAFFFGFIGLVFGVLSLFVSAAALQQARKSSGSGDNKAIKEKVQALNIRLDDMAAKVANSHTLIVKETGQVVEKIKILEEIIASRPAEMHPVRLEFDSGNNLDERVLKLEEVLASLSSGSMLPGSGQLAFSADTELELSLVDNDSSEIRLATIDEVLRASRNRFCTELRSIIEHRVDLGRQFLPTLGQLLSSHHFSDSVESFKRMLLEKGEDWELTPDQAQIIVRKSAAELLKRSSNAHFFDTVALQKPAVIVVAGANESEKLVVTAGVVKHFADNKRRVLVGACDVKQTTGSAELIEWCKRHELEILAPLEDDKPKRMAYKSVHRAQDEGFDVLVIDAVGSLYEQRELAAELKGIVHMLEREQPTGSQQVLVTVDGAKNEDGLGFVSQLRSAVPLSGLCIQRLHDAERGGILLSLINTANCPVCFVATGEQYQSMRVFSAEDYLEALFAVDEQETVGPLPEGPQHDAVAKKKREIASIL